MANVAIIGGGASGLCLAVMLKESVPDLSVAIYEASDRVGRKLAVTGNGRCNISNIKLSSDRYHGDTSFAMNVINGFNYQKQKEFFNSLGVPFCEEDEGKAYPMSLQATSVVDAFRFRLNELKVDLRLNSRVSSVKRVDNGFVVSTKTDEQRFQAVVIATGGQAGGRLGNTDGYDILKSLGHKIEKTFPAIVQLKTPTDIVRQLKGIKLMANVKAISSADTCCEFGEVLFCDYGLSGPPILQVSRLANNKDLTISLDILPKMAEIEVKNEILNRANRYPERTLSELFTGWLNKRLGQVVLKSAGIDINSNCRMLNELSAQSVAKIIKDFRFKITGDMGFENAQVTAGGAQASQFFTSCMSKKAKGLFAIGEVLDVDGDCGGFNLGFAWASAFACANGIKEYLAL